MDGGELVVGVALVAGGRVLAARRTHPPELAGRWELPGGKVQPGEDPTDAAVREVAEELGCEVRVTGWLAPSVPIPGGSGRVLRVAVAELVAGEPVPVEHDAVVWLRADQLAAPDVSGWLDGLDWLEGDRPFLPLVAALLEPGGRS